MKVNVKTYRLSTSEEVESELERVHRKDYDGDISDQAARTIASWYHSPAPRAQALTALSHGVEFDTVELSEDIERANMYPREYVAMRNWLSSLESLLSD